MGVKLDKIRKDNFDKIKTGSCIEFLCILDSFYCDFSRLDVFLDSCNDYLNNQSLCNLKSNFDSLKDVLTISFDMVLDDIDKSGSYCDFMAKYY